MVNGQWSMVNVQRSQLSLFPSQLFQIEVQHPLTAAVRRAHFFVCAQALPPVQIVRHHLQRARSATHFDSQTVWVHHILVPPSSAPLPGSRPVFCSVRRFSPLRPENFSAPSADNLRPALIRLFLLHFCLRYNFDRFFYGRLRSSQRHTPTFRWENVLRKSLIKSFLF